MDRNPELAQILNNPEMLRETMNLMSNPVSRVLHTQELGNLHRLMFWGFLWYLVFLPAYLSCLGQVVLGSCCALQPLVLETDRMWLLPASFTALPFSARVTTSIVAESFLALLHCCGVGQRKGAVRFQLLCCMCVCLGAI